MDIITSCSIAAIVINIFVVYILLDTRQINKKNQELSELMSKQDNISKITELTEKYTHPITTPDYIVHITDGIVYVHDKHMCVSEVIDQWDNDALKVILTQIRKAIHQRRDHVRSI